MLLGVPVDIKHIPLHLYLGGRLENIREQEEHQEEECDNQLHSSLHQDLVYTLDAFDDNIIQLEHFDTLR